jgi:glycosyltransferase involved in cell wall biosynthesis
VNGRFVPREHGAAGFAKAIVSILADSSEHARLSRGALDAAARFSIEAHVTRIEDILDKARAS